MGFHWPEVFIVLAVALIFLGPKRLPEAGRGLGKAIRGFRDETEGLRNDVSSIKEDATSLHREVAGVRDTVQGALTEGSQSPSAVSSMPEGESRAVSEPLPTGSNADLVK